MLQGPQAAAFVDSHLRSGLTPNESGIRSGLTPGGSGSIFPAPSPTTAAIFGLTTPAGISATSFPQTPLPVEAQTTESQLKPPKLEAAPQKSESTAVDSASVAANGLFLLSQGQADANKASSSSTSANSKSDKQEKKRASTRKSGRKTDEQSSNKRLRNMDGSASPIKQSSNYEDDDGKNSHSSNNSNEDDDDEDNNGNNADTRKMTEEEKRKNFLERNRVAALKCRQRKKQWLQSLQAKCDYYGNENDNLNKQISLLREQVVSLKTLLIAHKDCSASRALPPGQDPITLALGQDFVSGLQGIPSQPQGMQSHQMANRRFV